VARAAGVSRAWVSQIELGQAHDVGLRALCVMLAVVGLDLSARAYPGGSPWRDQGHQRLLERFRAMLPPGITWQTEVPLPIPGDPRSWDAMAGLWDRRVGVEAEVRLTDLQALERRLALKRRDGGVDRLVLVVADTRSNRTLVRSAAASLATTFPLQGRAAIAALRSPTDPQCDLLMLA
jgi:transcriptional regulator with XRE-family HTH domain